MCAYRILVVDDESFSRRMMQIVLEREGHQTLEAASGREALEVLAREPADMVLSDVMMPEMNGLDLLVELRHKYDLVQLPVLLVTGLDDSRTLSQAYAAGANDVLPKMSEQRWMLKRVSEQLELRSFRLAARAQLRRAELSQEQGPSHSSTDPEKHSAGTEPAVVSIGPLGVWNWDLLQQRIVYSARWKAILGYASDALANEPATWFDRIHPEDRPRLDKLLAEHQARKSSCLDLTVRMRHACGAYVTVHIFGMALFDAKGQAARMIGSMGRFSSESLMDLGEWLQVISRCRAAFRLFESEGPGTGFLPMERALEELEALVARYQ